VKYNLKFTTQFKKDYKLIVKQGFDIKKLEVVIELLQSGSHLPERYKDHPLWVSKDYKNCRELHIEPDMLLLYKYSNENLLVYMIRIGSHSELYV
jgi:mRNA interferase YafQ